MKDRSHCAAQLVDQTDLHIHRGPPASAWCWKGVNTTPDLFEEHLLRLNMVVHAYNSSICKVDAEESRF